MADIRDIIDSDGGKLLILLTLVATVLFSDVLKSLMQQYSAATKAVILVLVLLVMYVIYGGTDDQRGVTTPYDLFIRPFVGTYSALVEAYETLHRGYNAEAPETSDNGERAQIGTLLDIILIFLKPIIKWAVDNYEFLIALGIILWALDASGYYPAVQILGDLVTGILDWAISGLQSIVSGMIDWLAQQVKDAI